MLPRNLLFLVTIAVCFSAAFSKKLRRSNPPFDDISSAESNETEVEEFYTEIYTQLMKDTDNFKHKVDCLIIRLREHNLGGRLMPIMYDNANKMHKEVQIFVDRYDFSCGVVGFFHSPEGISLVSVDILLAVVLLVLCAKKIN